MLYFLALYQNKVFDLYCKNCQIVISSDNDLRNNCRYISGKLLQFCGTYCTESYENKLRLCSFCQKDLVGCDFEVIIEII